MHGPPSTASLSTASSQWVTDVKAGHSPHGVEEGSGIDVTADAN